MTGLVLKYFSSTVHQINKFTGWLIAILLGLMSIFIIWQVLARYLFGSSLFWSEELARFLMIWIVLLGSALALSKKELITVDILPSILSVKLKHKLKMTSHLVSMIFYVVLLFYGWDLAMSTASQTAPSLRVSMFWAYLSLPVGGLLLVLNTIHVIIEDYLKVKVGETK